MISRRTALVLAEAYAKAFSTSYRHRVGSLPSKTQYKVEVDKLYDFLFSCDYSAWFCNKAKTTYHYSDNRSNATRKLKEFLMKLHTGETQAEATLKWAQQQREKLGQEYLQNLAGDILNKWHKDWKSQPDSRPQIDEEIRQLLAHLELDGYVYRDLQLLIPESSVLDVAEEVHILESLYTSLKLANKDTAFHHLRLSEEHYLGRKWDDSISNSRKFLECVLQEVAAHHSLQVKRSALSESILTRPVRIREYLEKEGLLEPKEKEVVTSVYGLLSETGSHPYMAHNDQARLLRYLSLTLAQFVMLRLQGSISK